MKHLAIRSLSMRSPRTYTCPGFGDRVHSCILAYNYARAHNTQVTLHLTYDKWDLYRGAKGDGKKKSWMDILSLFPKDIIFLRNWPIYGTSEEVWLDHLKQNGVDAEIYHYADCSHQHPLETITNIDISQYLYTPVRLTAEDCSADIDLPEKFVTVQWDSSAQSRTFSGMMLEGIHDKYRNQGFEIVTVGGAAENPKLRGDTLKYVAHAMSKGTYHVGTESGYLQFAQLYHEYKDIHLYSKINSGVVSHHLDRAIKNGCTYTML